jgi:hypothetical protein
LALEVNCCLYISGPDRQSGLGHALTTLTHISTNLTEPVMVEFSDFRGLFAALPSGSLALDDVRTPEFCIYEDRRVVAYYAPFDYLNRLARVALVGVTPGPTQMRESYAVVRDALRAGQSDQQVLQAVKARASLKGMRRDLARWLDELGLAALVGLRSCSELFQDSHRGLLHTTSAVRYPVFVRKGDGTLANYSGSNPEFVAHPWLRDMIETTLAGELSALPSAIVISLGRASRAVADLQHQGVLDPTRCLTGLPHPSPVSSQRERYFRDAKAHLLSQVRHLATDAAATAPPRPQPQNSQLRTVATPSGRPVPGEPTDTIVIGLTQGNLNNGHVYLRQHLDFFPADAIGAADARNGQGVPLTVHFAGLPEAARTDIAGDKGIFRSRGPWRKFFARHGLRPGDTVIIERLSAHEYRVVPGR